MPKLIKESSTKRGDTLIEVMFAITIFALVAVLSIAMMNAGIASGERSLELVTARNELNAQAEAIRFIHSSYVSELTLPACNEVAAGEKCQQYAALWEKIKNNAMEPTNSGTSNAYSIPSPVDVCAKVYEADDKGKSLLEKNHAFIINTRILNESVRGKSDAYILAQGGTKNNVSADAEDPDPGIIFRPALLNARLVYSNNKTGEDKSDDTGFSANSALTGNPLNYTNLAAAEGIWVVAVKGGTGTSTGISRAYYDFYIQTCWYGSNTNSPTSLDTVIRLYNPEGV